jgi:predicted nucleic acid-binding protein
MTVYFDTCALNRLSDDQSQMRILSESQAVERMLRLTATDKIRWLASSALHLELSRNPDPVKRADSLALLPLASGLVPASPSTFQRARSLQAEGYGVFDALHLAICEENNVDSLITVDDRFLRRASLRLRGTRPEVINPVDWLQRR